MVSHADTDHAGGVDALLADHQVAQWWAPAGESLSIPSQRCEQGQRWQRDGITYRILWPPSGENTLSSNDRSCVLAVYAGEHSLLITGDVGRQVERQLLPQLNGNVVYWWRATTAAAPARVFSLCARRSHITWFSALGETMRSATLPTTLCGAFGSSIAAYGTRPGRRA